MEFKKQERVSSSSSSLDDYCLDRLFDPEDLYYTPMDMLLKRYKKRDLIPGRIYNLARKYGHVPKMRERKIIAPQMERAGQRILGTENFYYPPPKVYFCTMPIKNENETNKSNTKIHNKESINEETDEDDQDDDDGGESESDNDSSMNEDNYNYEDWVKYRRKLRAGLDNLELDYEYLKRKKDLTEMERRILNSMMFIDKQIQTDPISEIYPIRVKSSDIPKIKYPTPILMERIEQFLEKNKWRLLDLFKDLDKNKDWKVLKSDFIREFKNGRFEGNEATVDELINALASNDSKYINYKSLSNGRTSHLLERRNQQRESSMGSRLSDEYNLKDYQDQDDYLAHTKQKPTGYNAIKILEPTGRNSNEEHRDSSTIQSRTGTNSSSLSSNSKYLQLPKINTSPSQYPSNYADLFKDRGVSAASTSLNQTALIAKRLSVDKDYLNESKSRMGQLRAKIEEDYFDCLKRTKSLKLIDSSRLKHGLTLPDEIDFDDLILFLKNKAKKERKFRKSLLKQEVPSKKSKSLKN